jgi:hypothetical protein
VTNGGILRRAGDFPAYSNGNPELLTRTIEAIRTISPREAGGTLVARLGVQLTQLKGTVMAPTERNSGTAGHAVEDGTIHARIQAEYREMPGLKLTLAQASRLFNLEPHRCARALETLVSGGVLWTDGRTFLPAGDGRRCA